MSERVKECEWEMWRWVNWNCEIRQQYSSDAQPKESVQAEKTYNGQTEEHTHVCVCIVTIPKSLCTIIYCEPFSVFPIPYGRKFVWLEECWLQFIICARYDQFFTAMKCSSSKRTKTFQFINCSVSNTQNSIALNRGHFSASLCFNSLKWKCFKSFLF